MFFPPMSGFCTVSDFSVELKMEPSVAGNVLGGDDVTQTKAWG